MDRDARTLTLLCGLARAEKRREAADLLAAHLGAKTLLLFVWEARLKAFLPAPQMPQTIPGGPGWRNLLRGAAEPGELRWQVLYPDARTTQPALAHATKDGLLLVLIGGEPALGEAQTLCLPLLASTLAAELEVVGMRGRESAALAEARHVATLAAVLDATRGDLERTLQTARVLNDDLQRAAQAKDEFLAMLAHELRNPLSPIVSALELLRLQGTGKGAQPRLLEVMDRQVRHLTRLVDDLLDVSRISRGVISLRREAMTVQDALAQAVESVRPVIDAEGHRLALTVPEEPLTVFGDPVRLTQVFANLIHNAAKYTDRGGQISLSARRENGEVVVCVRDSGIGIAPHMLPRIFELFTQAPQALDRAKGGLGIGLTLVARLLALHGGTVAAKSEGIGKGSEFEVRLPLYAQAARAAAAPVALPARKAPLRVLVVDDNVDAADVLAEMLRLGNFIVEVAHDGEAALALAIGFRPHVALLDIGLPKMDGYAVAHELRALLPSTRTVALTGYGDAAHRARSVRAGFDEHLVKPVELSQLLALLDVFARDQDLDLAAQVPSAPSAG